MNIPDEYWTKEAPTEPGVYAVKWHDGVVSVQMLRPQHNREEFAAWHRGCCFCRLAPAAEVDRLKAELQEIGYVRNNDLGELVHLLAQLENVKAENEKLRQWVRDAFCEGGDVESQLTGLKPWARSTALARLEGRAE